MTMRPADVSGVSYYSSTTYASYYGILVWIVQSRERTESGQLLWSGD